MGRTACTPDVRCRKLDVLGQVLRSEVLIGKFWIQRLVAKVRTTCVNKLPDPDHA
jgi:hypothetical protein